MTDAERAEYIRFINDQYDLLIKKIAVEILEDEDLVYDVKQQVLMNLIPKVEFLMTLHPRQVTTYVATTTKHVAITEYHKKTNYENHTEEMIDSYTKLFNMDHVEFKAFGEKYGFGEELWELLMELKPLDRDIMIYKYYYDLKVGEIAAVTGTNREVVKKRLQRTRKKLADLIEEKGADFR